MVAELCDVLVLLLIGLFCNRLYDNSKTFEKANKLNLQGPVLYLIPSIPLPYQIKALSFNFVFKFIINPSQKYLIVNIF